MKVSEFAKELQTSFGLFFENEVETEVRFGGGEFSVTGYLVPQKWWIVTEKVCIYDIRIEFSSTLNPKPMVTYIDFPILGDTPFYETKTLEEAIIFIKENLATVNSKVVYDNL